MCRTICLQKRGLGIDPGGCSGLAEGASRERCGSEMIARVTASVTGDDFSIQFCHLADKEDFTCQPAFWSLFFCFRPQHLLESKRVKGNRRHWRLAFAST